ncbi:MAG: helix-turn-helix domain-containing protein [Solirubrobacteraceae bacterium]
MRTLISEIVVTVTDTPRQAEVEICWEGGARTQLTVPLVHRGVESTRTPEDAAALIRRLAAHTSDRQIAAIPNNQGRRTGTGLPFTDPHVKFLRQKHGIRAAPPPDTDSDLGTIEQAASKLGVNHTTIYRWLRAGLLPGEQTTVHAP